MERMEREMAMEFMLETMAEFMKVNGCKIGDMAMATKFSKTEISTEVSI
jgi:hypothetical protein